MTAADPPAADDLTVVCEAALEWSGEYGWSPGMRPRARAVFDAVTRLRPDLIPPEARPR